MKTIIVNPSKSLIRKTPSKGCQAKWHIGNKWYKQDYVGFESAGETISSRVAHILNVILPIVDYSPCYLKLPTGIFIGSESESFLSSGDFENTAQGILEADMGVSIAKAMEPTQQIYCLLSMHPELADQLSCLLQFDRIVKNLDRHMYNIVLRNLKEIILFDNGDSCTADVTYDYPESATKQEILAVDTAKPLMKSFDASCECLSAFSAFRLKAVNNKLLISDLYEVYPKWFLDRVTWLLSHQFQTYLGINLEFF